MPGDELLSETVVFELPGPVGAERLCERLRHRWRCQIYDHEGSLVAVELTPREGDLAVLLRTAEEWLEDSPNSTLPFNVDGCAYVMRRTRSSTPTAA